MIAWIWSWGPVIGQMTAIFMASSMSDVPSLPGGLSSYTGHFIGYALLSALAFRAFGRARWAGLSSANAWRAVALAAAYGVTDEIHQMFVVSRTPSLADWLIDTAGAAAGVLLVALAARVHRRDTRRDI